MADELTAESEYFRPPVDAQLAGLYDLLGAFVAQGVEFGTVNASMSDEAVRDVLRPLMRLIAGADIAPALADLGPNPCQDAGPEFLERFERMTVDDFFELAEWHCAVSLAAYKDAKRWEPNDSEAVAEAEAWTRRRRSGIDRERARLGLSKFSTEQSEPQSPVIKPRRRRSRARGPPLDDGEDDDDPHEVAPNAVRFYWQLAVRDSSLSSTQKLVALIYATHMDPDGTKAWPGAELLEPETGLHKGTVKRVRGELERLGWLTADRRPGRTTIYAAAFPRGVILDDPPVTDDDPGVSEDDEGGPRGRPDLVIEVVPDDFPSPSAAPSGAALAWQSVRRDRCRTCDGLEQVDGEGLCTGCWVAERAA
jgi:hypothetical protein